MSGDMVDLGDSGRLISLFVIDGVQRGLFEEHLAARLDSAS
jgi:hypothetical protein